VDKDREAIARGMNDQYALSAVQDYRERQLSDMAQQSLHVRYQG